MKYVLILVLLAAGGAICAAQKPPQNLDFEGPVLIGRDVGWTSPMTGYRAEICTENVKEGRSCARLSSLDSHRLSPFGNLMQVWDAKPYLGQRIKVRGALRTDLPDGPHTARLWMRIDLTGDRTGFLDNMSGRKINHGDWRYYEMIANVPPDALTINFGLMLITEGHAWLDDVSISTVPVSASEPRAADVQSLENLVAFTRLLGYVRFFHPSDEAARVDWNAFAAAGVLAAESAKDNAQLAQRLNEHFQSIAPTVEVWAGGAEPPLHPALLPDNSSNLGLIRWEHHGANFGSTEQPRDERRLSPGTAPPSGWPSPQQPFQAEIVDGVSCRVPLVLLTRSDITLPSLSGIWLGDARKNGDRATRLAAVALTWTALQHFYPHFDTLETDWNDALREALTAAAADPDAKAFLRTLQRLIAQLDDGQAQVSQPNVQSAYMLPLNWTWVADALVVTRVEPGLTDAPRAGDVVTRIDGRSVAERRTAAEWHISAATPGARAYQLLSELAKSDAPGEAKLELRDANGATRTVRVPRVSHTQPPRESRPAPISELRPGVMYVDLDRIRDQDFAAALAQLTTAKGLIFDLRGDSSQLSFVALQHLLSESGASAPCGLPVVTRPDREGVTYERSSTPLVPLTPTLSAKIAFLTDGGALGAAEAQLAIVEHYRLGAIVGSPTAGTCGDVVRLDVSGGYQVRFTGTKVLKHDGTRLHGVGIRPTLPVLRTIAGIAAGKDELLERAIEVVTAP